MSEERAGAAVASPVLDARPAAPSPSPSPGLPPEAAAALDRLLTLLHEEEGRPELNLSWRTIWVRTWEHTKDVYWETFVADCLVWPPLQLINFSFVPLKYQVLYVNAANVSVRARAATSLPSSRPDLHR